MPLIPMALSGSMATDVNTDPWSDWAVGPRHGPWQQPRLDVTTILVGRVDYLDQHGSIGSMVLETPHLYMAPSLDPDPGYMHQDRWRHYYPEKKFKK